MLPPIQIILLLEQGQYISAASTTLIKTITINIYLKIKASAIDWYGIHVEIVGLARLSSVGYSATCLVAMFAQCNVFLHVHGRVRENQRKKQNIKTKLLLS